jgi:hypothetical protein
MPKGQRIDIFGICKRCGFAGKRIDHDTR